MAKDKKKKKDKKDKKGAKESIATNATSRLKTLSQNPVVADIVAAALVATAAALKDSNKARQLASDAGDELAKLSKAGAEKGNVLWDMALEIGRRSLDELMSADAPKRPKSKVGGKSGAAKDR